MHPQMASRSNASLFHAHEPARDVGSLDRIVLPPVDGNTSRPPVRIFVGTEHGQVRTERVFVWSIEQVRDRRRGYEIVLMKDLPGFDRRRWLTGFTNYRFVIPELAGREGRAIYNDVDQIYLADPAELFDTDMQGCGFLSINPRDTSVMLIDCARMAPIWTPERARGSRRKAVERHATRQAGVWGPLDGSWNARDEEYDPETSRLLHYTTIHTQPWMPFPRAFVYQANDLSHLWTGLERSAGEAGYELFSAEHPSARFRALIDRYVLSEARERRQRRARSTAPGDLERREAALSRARATTVLEVGIGHFDADTLAQEEIEGRRVVRMDSAVAHLAKPPQELFDAVVCVGGLDGVADEDVPWLLDSYFRLARRLVILSLDRESGERDPEEERRSIARDRFWWSEKLARASLQHPDVHWLALASTRRASGAVRLWARERAGTHGPPRLWVLADEKAGHTTQSLGLAEALRWPFETKTLRFNPLNRLSHHLLGATAATLTRDSRRELVPPWPDVVIATGRQLAPVARFVAEQSEGHTRIVQLGRKGAHVAEPFDLALSCSHFAHLPHRRRHETLATINRIDDARLEAEAAHWRGRLRPGFVGLLVGGSSAVHEVDAAVARQMAHEVTDFARRAGRRVVAVTSPRTPDAARRALEEGLGADGEVLPWDPDPARNPYLGCLALADALVVTADSESMLGEAVAVGRPVFLYPLAERRPGIRGWLASWINARSLARPRKRKKGTVRPQQGVEAFCARLIAGGWVHVPRDMERLYRGLEERGVLHRFGSPFRSSPTPPLREADEVAQRVRTMLGVR